MKRHVLASMLVWLGPAVGAVSTAGASDPPDPATARKAGVSNQEKEAGEREPPGGEKKAGDEERVRCTPGSKSIYFDLGNDLFRDPESVGRSPASSAARVGGNMAAGS